MIVGLATCDLRTDKNDFSTKMATRATIAKVSTERPLVEVAASSDEATEWSEYCGAWR